MPGVGVWARLVIEKSTRIFLPSNTEQKLKLGSNWCVELRQNSSMWRKSTCVSQRVPCSSRIINALKGEKSKTPRLKDFIRNQARVWKVSSHLARFSIQDNLALLKRPKPPKLLLQVPSSIQFSPLGLFLTLVFLRGEGEAMKGGDEPFFHMMNVDLP